MITSGSRRVYKGILIDPKEKTIKTLFNYDNEWADDDAERIINNKVQLIEWDKYLAFQELGESMELQETLDNGVFYDVLNTSNGYFVGKVFIVGFNKMQEAIIPDEGGSRIFLSEYELVSRIRWIEFEDISKEDFTILSN